MKEIKKCKYCHFCIMELDKNICYKDIRDDKLYYIPDIESKCLFGYPISKEETESIR